MAQVGIAGYPAPQNVAMVPFIPYVSDGFTGVHPTIQTITMDSIRIMYVNFCGTFILVLLPFPRYH